MPARTRALGGTHLAAAPDSRFREGDTAALVSSKSNALLRRNKNKAGRNSSKARGNKNKAQRNEIQIGRNKIQI